MLRARNTLILASLSVVLVAAVSCTDSEPINIKGTGAAGTPGAGAAGTTGAAGTPSTGAAGTPGAAGTSGAAGTGTPAGTAGTTGVAGSGSGTAGKTGLAGTSGSAGSGAGTAGTTGTAGSGADAGTDAGGGGALSFATDIYPFIKTQCTPCHTTNTDGQLSLKDAATAYTNLVGTTMGVAAKTNLSCTMLDTTKKRVVVGDPTHSYLYIKVSQTNAQLMPAGCQPAMPEMPQSTLTLTSAQVTKIHDWIMGGAKP